MPSKNWFLALLAVVVPLATTNAQQNSPANPTPVTTSDPRVPLENLKVMVKPLDREELQVEADAWFELLKAKARQIAVVRLSVKKANEAMAADDAEQAESVLRAAEKAKKLVDEEAAKTEANITRAAQDQVGVDVGSPDKQSEEGEQDAPKTRTDQSKVSDDDADQIKDQLLTDITVLQDQRTALSDRLSVVIDSLESKGGDVAVYRQYIIAVSGVELDTSDAKAAWSTIVGWFSSKEGGQRWAWNLSSFFLILLVAYLLAKILALVVNWLLERKVKLSRLAERLIASTIKNVLMLVGFAVALTALEIDVTPILAAIGATGLVVGLALQGTLSNFASGLMILINRPFDVGDVVSAGGVTGTVHQMNLVSTTFHTFDNQTIHVPNNEIWNNVITNITGNDTRRVDLEFGVGYDDDFEKAEQIIEGVVRDHELVLPDPEPVIVTHALGDSSVNIVCRPWTETGNWWKVKTDVVREVKRRFDQAGISIPFPQQDVHIHQAEANVVSRS